MPQVDQVAHDGHHWWIHHACGQSGNTVYRKLMKTNSGLNVNDCVLPQPCQDSSLLSAKSWGKLPTMYLSLKTDQRCLRLGLELRLPFACSLPCLIMSSTVSETACSPLGTCLLFWRPRGMLVTGCVNPEPASCGCFPDSLFSGPHHPLPSKSGYTTCLTQPPPHPQLSLRLKLWELKSESIERIRRNQNRKDSEGLPGPTQETKIKRGLLI